MKISGAVLILCMTVLCALGSAMAADPEPAHRPIWEYQQELSLSPKQVQTMKDTVSRLQTAVQSKTKAMQAKEDEANALVHKKAPLADIKAKLTEVAALGVERQMEDIKASRKILDVLSPEQLKKWHEIQTAIIRSGQ